MKTLRFALFGAGFWSRFQLAGWQELPSVECVAIYNRTRAKAEALAQEFGVPAVYDDPVALLDTERIDFADICTSADTHRALTEMAAARGIDVVCQKPMAESFSEAECMIHRCRDAGVRFYVNENWRWQEPIRALKAVLDAGTVGEVFRARIRMVSGFPVFQNQPFLRELDRFLLVDIGSHILDVARFLFGEPATLYCITNRVQSEIRGEDLATVTLKTAAGATIICEMGYPGSPHENDSFPQTYAFVEGTRGSAGLSRDYWIRTVTAAGTEERQVVPRHYPWADPAYDVVHSSIVPCQRDLLAGLRGERTPETSGDDNLRTIGLVYGAYESAERNEVIRL